MVYIDLAPAWRHNLVMRKWLFILMVMLIAATSMIYQFSVTTALIFILGDSLVLFSIFTGLFLFSMGLGAFLAGKKNSCLELLTNLQLTMASAGLLVLPLIFLSFGFLTQVRRNQLLVSAASTAASPLAEVILWSIGIGAEIGFGMLTGMHLPLLQDLFEDTGQTVAAILSYDYIGSFLGALLFPIVLFPYLGLFRTVFLAAFINLLLAGFSRNYAKTSKTPKTYFLFLLSFMFICLASINSAKFELYIDRLIYGLP
jgi:spermidine synthase